MVEEKFIQCNTCGHFKSWHDENADGRLCGAYTPDTADFKCACKGWSVKVEVKEQTPWGSSRKDLQG